MHSSSNKQPYSYLLLYTTDELVGGANWRTKIAIDPFELLTFVVYVNATIQIAFELERWE